MLVESRLLGRHEHLLLHVALVVDDMPGATPVRGPYLRHFHRKPVEFGHPRNLAQVAGSDLALSSRTRGRIIRAEAAAVDTIESAPYFAVAILAGNQVGLPNGALNALSLAYLATRMAYIDAYIFSETLAVAVLRAALFSVGHMIIWSVFILAGMHA